MFEFEKNYNQYVLLDMQIGPTYTTNKSGRCREINSPA